MNSQILKFMLIGLTADNETKKAIPTDINEDNLMGLLGIEVSSHAKE